MVGWHGAARVLDLRVVTHTPPSRAGGRKRNPQGTRERLVRAAVELFTTQGYHASTTPQIAARAGVAEGTIYRHFPSKEHLLNEIYRSGLRIFVKPVRESDPRLPCRERMEAVALAWREVAARDPLLVQLVFARRFINLLDEKSRTAFLELREELEKVLASGKAAGAVRAGAATVWADVWLRLITLMLERVAAREWKIDDTAPRAVIQGAWDAIRSQPEASPA